MKLVCPGCGAQGAIELFSADANARQFAALMGRVPPQLASATLAYLSLFRPPSKALAWSRGRSLLDELVTAIEAGAVRRRGRDWAVTPADFKTAMEEMVRLRSLDKLDLPLKNHNYLLEILKSGSDKAEAKTEREAETKLRSSSASDRNRRLVAMSDLQNEQQARERHGQPLLAGDALTKFLADRGVTDDD